MRERPLRDADAGERREHRRQLAYGDARAVVEVMGGGEQPGAEPVGGRAAPAGGEVGVPAADGRAADFATPDADAEEPHAGPYDFGQVGDRCLLDAAPVEPAAALRALRLGDRDLDRRLGEALDRRGLPPPERPLAGLAAGPLGVLDAGPFRERRRLPLPQPLQRLDIRPQRHDLRRLDLDQGGQFVDQPHQSVTIEFGEFGVRHGRRVTAGNARGKRR